MVPPSLGLTGEQAGAQHQQHAHFHFSEIVTIFNLKGVSHLTLCFKSTRISSSKGTVHGDGSGRKWYIDRSSLKGEACRFLANVPRPYHVRVSQRFLILLSFEELNSSLPLLANIQCTVGHEQKVEILLKGDLFKIVMKYTGT
jgi:hypothetical protein